MSARHHHLTPAAAIASRDVSAFDGMPRPDLIGLVTGAQRADPQALDDLLAVHMPLVYAVVGRALRRRCDVDDVVQETLLCVVRGVRALRDPASFRAWLVAIALRQVHTYLRRQRTPAYTRAVDAETEPADPAAQVQDVAILRLHLLEQGRQVVQASRWLDAGHRPLFPLWWQETTGELDRAALARAAGVTVAHAGVRIQRMREQLERGRAIVAALAARPRCPQLTVVIGDWDGRRTSVWRKRIGRHVRCCTTCAGRSDDMVDTQRLPEALSLLAVPRAVLDGRHAPSADAGGPPGRRGYTGITLFSCDKHHFLDGGREQSLRYATSLAGASPTEAGRPGPHPSAGGTPWSATKHRPGCPDAGPGAPDWSPCW
ncbi:MAG: sigma-70 family RNA polymerase sigma factor [Hamadaea sp.]|nr:sigma-70 family RNA polymerase sigma factor [Hamadaea sp.]